ncbi:MAG: DUF1934 domain-containing protein [Lachnospiraceae bacterium]
MTKEVLLTISGLQFAQETGVENIEIITAGDYYKKNDVHYVIYDEVTEGMEGSTKNIIKVRENKLDVTKKGTSNVHMIFEKNKKNNTYYFTPFGSLLIGIDAKNIALKEEEKAIDVKVEYELEVNHEHLADCVISLNIKSREDKNFTLQ